MLRYARFSWCDIYVAFIGLDKTFNILWMKYRVVREFSLLALRQHFFGVSIFLLTPPLLSIEQYPSSNQERIVFFIQINCMGQG